MNFSEKIATAIEEFSRSFRAWFKSAVISCPVLCVLFGCFFLIVSGGRMEPLHFLGLLVMSSAFYIVAYTLIGIPFFVFFWPQDDSGVWRIKRSLPTGALLGYFGVWLVFSILDSGPMNPFDLEAAGACLYGAAYGAITAFVAWKIKKAHLFASFNPSLPTESENTAE